MYVCVCVEFIFQRDGSIPFARLIDEAALARGCVTKTRESTREGSYKKKKKKKKEKAKISGFSGGFQCVKSVCKRVYMYKISGREAES